MTSDEINALPERVRKYIHDLETRCDPAGDVAKLALQRDAIAGLERRILELVEERDGARRAAFDELVGASCAGRDHIPKDPRCYGDCEWRDLIGCEALKTAVLDALKGQP